MVLEDIGTNNQKVRDELSSEPDLQPIYKIKSEVIKLEEGPTKVSHSAIGASWIVGSSTNGLVGTNVTTQSAGQQVVGEADRITATFSVTNPNNTYRERFNFDTFNDSGVTTADWGSSVLDMTAAEVAQSTSIAYNTGTLTSAMIIVRLSAGSVSDLAIQLSADGGSHWETFTNGVSQAFVNSGTDLRFKLTASGNVTITAIRVAYA